MRIKNIDGISDNTCACGSWLEHWKRYSGQALPRLCPEEKCLQKPEVGVHVQKDDSIDHRWYIVPLCQKHNELRGKSLNIMDNVKLVSADVSITCGKR